jgi:chorismate--pyruvate lyase
MGENTRQNMKAVSPDTLWLNRPHCADSRLRRWLLDRGSLTRRIQARCDRFRLDVLAQHSAPADRDECALIGAGHSVRCLVREVTLNCGSNAVVFAHSVVEPHTLHGAWRMLTTLGRRPLAAVLFADSRVRRYPMRFRQLNARHELYGRASALLGSPPASLWARRTLYVLKRSRLLVTEVFLPAILTLAP